MPKRASLGDWEKWREQDFKRGHQVAIELRERLSEFSYGYGVTRETEHLLRQIGIRPVPFLPSLLQEADLGFDVAFERPGAPLLLQF